MRTIRPWFRACLIGLVWSFCHGESGADPTRYFSLSIDNQPLESALQQFANQSGVQIVFFSQITEGLQAPEVRGRYTLAAGLSRMLTGTKLTFRVINSRTVEILPVAAR
ncbi:MAG: STN domain-containing protein [Gammaproteobacteria bacterium]